MTFPVLPKTGGLGALLLAAALAAPFGGGALAQAPAPEAPAAAPETPPETPNEIIVEAPRRVPVPRADSRDPFTGAAVTVTTVQMQLLYGDLDLSSEDGANSLRTRIERVAQAACKELDRLYPFNPDPECVGKTVAKAEPLAQAAIAAARPEATPIG